MGVYINPGNEGFRTVRNGRYVDKSGLVGVMNGTIDTKRKLSCISRPRRFGKSYAAQMLCAYYDRSCDSAPLFDDLAIARDASYHAHLNRYNVLYLDITNIIGEAKDRDDIVPFIRRHVCAEVHELMPEIAETDSISVMLAKMAERTGCKFIAIIDEWDALVRDGISTDAQQKTYFEFLRLLFKSSGTTDKLFAAAYMTGILPIKKGGCQSAVRLSRRAYQVPVYSRSDGSSPLVREAVWKFYGSPSSFTSVLKKILPVLAYIVSFHSKRS